MVRECTETCGQKEKHNECVSVVGHSPYEATVDVCKWGKRKATTRTERRQHVDVFFGFSPVGEKPATRYHITMQEDIVHFLKTGHVLHGEWFYHGKRIPGGDHSKALPDGVEEWASGSPELAAHVLKDFGVKLEITDGCNGQYDGKKNHHQTAVHKTKTRALMTPSQQAAAARAPARRPRASSSSGGGSSSDSGGTSIGDGNGNFVVCGLCAPITGQVTCHGIPKQHLENITQHGKCACDGYSNVPKYAVADAMRNPDAVLQSGTRELVLYLALAREKPTVPADKKHGWWAANCYFWGFYDPAVFARVDVPDAKPLANCAKLHDHIGLNNEDVDGSTGSLYARFTFCACDKCLDFKFPECSVLSKFGAVEDMLGSMELHHCPRLAPTRVISTTERTLSLATFAQGLKTDREGCRDAHGTRKATVRRRRRLRWQWEFWGRRGGVFAHFDR